jgi:23S rRNA (uracil1939-C5)-methyltransferase
MNPTQPSSAPPPGDGHVVRIEAVGGQGDGIAAGRVFAPFTLPGELVRVRGTDRPELLEVIEASPDRVVPPCPHFGACGGCALQHWRHAPYLQWKANQVEAALSREGLEAQVLPAFAAPPGSRRRIALHARRAGAVRLGYKARRSWDLVEIIVCPISDPRLVAALPALRTIAGPLFEHRKSAPTLHCTWTATGLDVDITGVERKSGGLSADARMRIAAAAGAADMARVTLAGDILYMARQPMIRFGQAVVALPPGGFLQAVPAAEAAMAAFAVEALAGTHRIADLFCGAGAFTFPLAAIAPVHGADGDAAAIAALTAAVGGAPGLKAVSAAARDLFRRPMLAQDLKRFDAVVFDPPRAGAEAQAREIAASGVSRVVGVSCNPATFARDARILVDAGFALHRVLPVDQFLWSPHVELVSLFAR